ncbi:MULTISPECIES: DUF1351 domain-containing protein [Vagococcus]|uniref:DUF1351 domain-containing protein n=1 Tax=Vagococcus TaxID=2737 RepID=UPI00131428ED|nr:MULTISPECIES: DUF1351 domain-containing protein [Vagococcus]
MSNELATERKIYLDFTPAVLDMTNYDELKVEVEKYADKYKGLVFTRDEKTGANQARSELLALQNAIESERKNVKQVYNKPLKEFEDQIKELTKLIDEPLNDIREGLKVIEDAEKDERKTALMTLLRSKLESLDICIEDLEMEARWLNKGNWTSKLNPTSKFEADIDQVIAQALKEKERKETELRILTEFCKAQGIEAAGWTSQLEFKSALEVIDLINLEKERKDRLAAEQEQKRKEHEEFIAKQQETIKEANEFAGMEQTNNQQETKISNVIRVTGTIKQLNTLNDFLINSGIEVEEVNAQEELTQDSLTIDDLPW